MEEAQRPEPSAGSPAEPREGALLVRPAEPRDVPALLELFGALAEYEHLTHELRATEQGLAAALFAPKPVAEALIAERDGVALGYALYFATFSSFLTSTGIWLEDLFVRPAHRGEGVGRALLSTVAARVREQGGERLEWAALDWNELALGFYRRIGARTMGEWITHRLDGEALERLAVGAAASLPNAPSPKRRDEPS
ncbi:MAG TPA: GNAT family N-acetyltransferase [Solirubrobacteraceae bacterium]|nr:GNAT family N-acetyltransferase [Solirubrobacteraceae bacterium]